MNPVVELGHAVNSRRADMGLTQAALAKLSGLSRATVNQVENGTVKDLTHSMSAWNLRVKSSNPWCNSSARQLSAGSARRSNRSGTGPFGSKGCLLNSHDRAKVSS
jgi:DNA-binding XRE family transcriptional regulator